MRKGKIYVAASKTVPTAEENALISLYNTGNPNLFGAPWMGNTNNFAKQRVDLYVSGKKGYVNNALVNYDNPSAAYEKFMDLSDIDSFEENGYTKEENITITSQYAPFS